MTSEFDRVDLTGPHRNAGAEDRFALGHSDVALTLGLYSHVTESVEADAAERVANAIFGSR